MCVSNFYRCSNCVKLRKFRFFFKERYCYVCYIHEYMQTKNNRVTIIILIFISCRLLQPHTVVVGRAAMLLECAHLVHNCNKGQWPYWLKSNMAKNPRKHSILRIFILRVDSINEFNYLYLQNVAVSSGPLQLRRQRLAGKLFYQWAEVSIRNQNLK